MKQFVKAIPLLDKIEQAGFDAYFVGGSVRDYIMQRPIGDIDIATSALPQEIKGIFPKTADVGIEHGTILVLYQGESYEITTFRTESKYEDFRHPGHVEFIRSLKEDLRRRDFTMNAIAMTKEGDIIDPFSGRDDIKKRLIRTVGEAKERFQEDALRMMRAVRFVGQLSFSLEEKTCEALHEFAPLLEHIAVERKLAEFSKLITSPNRKKALHTMVKQGLHQFLPELGENASSLLKTAELAQHKEFSENEMWALFLHLADAYDRADSILRQWKMSIKQIHGITSIMKALQWRLSNNWNRLAIYKFGKEVSLQAENVYSALENENQKDLIASLYDSLPIKSRRELCVTGKELMEWKNLESGPWIKTQLEKIERAVIEGEVTNEKSKIKEWLNR